MSSPASEVVPLVPYALYRWFDIKDRLLYIGKTRRLDRRVASHIARSEWMQFVARSTVERRETSGDLSRAERVAIETEHPIFNKQYNDTPAARERLRAYLEEAGRLDLLRQKQADADLIPAFWVDGADIIGQIERILASPCRHHALMRLMVVALIDGYRELPTGQELDALASKVHINRGTAYRLGQMIRRQARSHHATSQRGRLSHHATNDLPKK